MAKYVRVVGAPSILRHPDYDGLVVPDPGTAYRADDPLVLAYPWQFASDEELDQDPGEIVTEVQVRPVAKKATKAAK